MIIDSHVHLIRPFNSLGHPQVYARGPGVSAEDYINLMEAYGIDKAFFISWSPEDILSDLLMKNIDPYARTLRETMNREYALEVMEKYSNRFYWFPCHINPAVVNYLSLTRENLEMGASGIKLAPSFWGELPDSPRVLPLYDLVEEYGAHVILDTSFWYLGKDRQEGWFIGKDKQVGHREAAKQVKDFRDYLSHLRPIIRSHREVNFQLAHAGARQFTVEHAREVGEFIREYPNVYADLGALVSTQFNTEIECLVEAAGEDRVMFGTDWPHTAQGEKMYSAIENIRNNDKLTARARRKILGENASRFMQRRKKFY